MAQKIRKKRRGTNSAAYRRLIRIENSLKQIESEIDGTKERMDELDRLMVDLDDIKKKVNRRRRGFSLFSRRRRDPDSTGSNSGSSSLPPQAKKNPDLSELQNLLQNPALNSLLKKHGNSLLPQAQPKKNPDLSQLHNMLQNPKNKGDLSGLMGLLQNPAIQSMLKQGKGGLLPGMPGGKDPAQIMSLLQNPMVQSMLKNLFK